MRTDQKIESEIASIKESLTAIKEYIAWMILADQRFSVGQRVEWSLKGKKAGFPTRKKAQRGTVKSVNGFSIVVKLDGLKKPRSYHHAFFNPINGTKLF